MQEIPNTDQELNRKLDEIIETYENLLETQSFSIINDKLQDINIPNTTNVELLAVLSMTLCEKTNLPYRSTFYQQVKDKLLTQYTPEIVEKELQGLH